MAWHTLTAIYGLAQREFMAWHTLTATYGLAQKASSGEFSSGAEL
jgi:hypothetical protein